MGFFLGGAEAIKQVGTLGNLVWPNSWERRMSKRSAVLGKTTALWPLTPYLFFVASKIQYSKCGEQIVIGHAVEGFFTDFNYSVVDNHNVSLQQ